MRAMILVLFLTVAALAQPDTVRVAGDLPSGEGNLNRAIRTAAAANDLAHTAFLLERGGRYVLSESIIVPAGQRLTLIAPEPGQTPESRPPLLCWSAADNIDRRFLFDCFGDITLKNIWLFYATTAGWQTPSSLQIEDDPAADTSGKGEIGLFENVLFDYAGCPANASGAVGISAKHFHGTFRNCYFRNCADLHLSYYGRAVSFPFDTWGWHIDSLSFENCTFANLGYVYMQENDEYADFIQLNHCTILNTVMFPLERGMWHRLAVTNSIFFNTWMYGDIPAFTYPGRGPHGGTIEIDSLSQYPLSLPFAEEERHILFSHSSYFIETWLSDWMRDNPYSQDLRRQGEVLLIPHPQPMLNATTRAFFESERYP
ncbi:MAG TPA: hypothetical protein PLG50_15885, partial [bacterium]|nr:hypothetical protein [bacterium]